jgi:hypothetical protein
MSDIESPSRTLLHDAATDRPDRRIFRGRWILRSLADKKKDETFHEVAAFLSPVKKLCRDGKSIGLEINSGCSDGFIGGTGQV